MKSSAVILCVVAGLTTSSALAQVTATGRDAAPMQPNLADRVAINQGGPRAAPVDNSFTYQGYLEVSGAPATGAYDIRFTLYDSGGVIVAGPICRDNVHVSDGLFTVDLDFGSVFTGDTRMLEIAVRPGGAVGDCAAGGGYTTLSPREELTATPYALGVRLPFVASGANTGASTFSVANTSSATGSSGLLGIIVSPAVFGFADLAGVRGESSDYIGAGVLGISDTYVGTIGYSYGDGGVGTFGRADGVGGYGLMGWSVGSGGRGVYGWDAAGDGWAGYFRGRGYFENRVGIGTTSPAQMLDVNGYVKTNGYQMTPGAAAGRVLTSDASGFGTWQNAPMSIAYVGSTSGSTTNPAATNQFLSPTMTVTITAGQKIMVTANCAFGSISAGGAGGLDLYVGYRVSGSGAVPSNIGGGMFNHTCVQNERTNFGISGVITGLAAGTYEVGMTGDDDGNGQWNNNEWGYVTVMVIN